MLTLIYILYIYILEVLNRTFLATTISAIIQCCWPCSDVGNLQVGMHFPQPQTCMCDTFCVSCCFQPWMSLRLVN